MKLLVMGPAGAGKTSLLRATMENTAFMAIENLAPTRGVRREVYRFRGLLEIQAWDAGGQKVYQERYYSSQEEAIFGEVDLPIFMVDAVTVDPEIREQFDKFINKVVEKNPSLKKVHVLINKIDLPDSREAEIRDILEKDQPTSLKARMDVSAVSVKAGSAQARLIEICDEVIDARINKMARATKLRQVMEDFKRATGVDFILFNKRDGLVVTSTFGKFNAPTLQFMTFQLCALESNMYHVFTRVMELKGEKVTPLALNTVVFESITNFVLAKEVEDKATLMVVTKDKNVEELLKVVKGINDSNEIYVNLVNILQFE